MKIKVIFHKVAYEHTHECTNLNDFLLYTVHYRFVCGQLTTLEVETILSNARR